MEATMLIIDDLTINREVLKSLFQDKYVILEASTVNEGINIVQGCYGKIDVILLDLIMPELNGFDFLKMREEKGYLKDIPVVVITSSNDFDDQIKAFKLGANDFINKPFVPEIVYSRVNNIIAANQRMKMVEVEAKKLKVKSEIDQMTGLYNKVTAEWMINQVLELKSGQLHCLIAIDIDEFKSVNDTKGHLVGDHVIKIIADLIAAEFRTSDIIGRIGGDEFIVLMTSVPSMEIVYNKVNELVMIMKYKPNLTIPENVSLSIGIASNNNEAISYPELFKKADSALLRAKNDGRACYREYGVEPVTLINETKPILLLLSSNRNACSVINTLLPTTFRILEINDYQKLKNLEANIYEKIALVYADDTIDESGDFWKKLKAIEWINFAKVISICEEGNLPQYAISMKAGVADIITSPIDINVLKRRTIRLINDED